MFQDPRTYKVLVLRLGEGWEMREAEVHHRPWVLLDDDPTGAQLSSGVSVMLEWEADDFVTALADNPPAIHVITNTRSEKPRQAQHVTRSAAEATLACGVRPTSIVLRGDSTLRAHLHEEYEGLREAAFHGETPALMLAPAMPSAGRVTRNGLHFLVRNGDAVPIAETEYANDGLFAYGSSRLLEYAEERSRGFFDVDKGIEVSLRRLLRGGAEAVAHALEAAHAHGPAVVAVDAEKEEHLEIVRQGFDLAVANDIPVILRCSPAMAAVLAGGASPLIRIPPADGGVLVIIGSYVGNTTRQLAEVLRSRADLLVEVDVVALASTRAAPEVSRAATDAGRLLRTRGLAVVATPRDRPPKLQDLKSGRRIAYHLSQIAASVHPVPSVVLTKGGITSAVTLRDGFQVRTARVAGPIMPGVSYWSASNDHPGFIVFPGNVGDVHALASIVDDLTRSIPVEIGQEAWPCP